MRNKFKQLISKQDDEFHPSFATYRRQAFYSALLYYAVVSIIFALVTGLFKQPTRFTHKLSIPKLDDYRLDNEIIQLRRQDQNSVFIADNGTVSAVDDQDEILAAMKTYKELVKFRYIHNLVLTIAGFDTTEVAALRKVWLGLKSQWPQDLSLQTHIEVLHDTDLSSSALCGNELDEFWNGHRLPFPRDSHVTAQRIRQALEVYFIADAPVLVHAPITSRIILWKTPQPLACIRTAKATIVDLLDMGSLVVLPSDTSFSNTTAYLYAAWRSAVGLPELSFCDHLALPDKPCVHESRAVVAPWEAQLIQASAAKELTQRLQHNIQQVKEIEHTFWQHEWNAEGERLLTDLQMKLNELTQTVPADAKLRQIAEAELMSFALLNGSNFERRPYLPPSFLAALWGPVVLTCILPFTSFLRYVIASAKQWRKNRRLSGIVPSGQE